MTEISKKMVTVKKKLDAITTLVETFAKKPFPRQPKPQNRFSAISPPIPPDFTPIPPP